MFAPGLHPGSLQQCHSAFLYCQRLEQHRWALGPNRRRWDGFQIEATSTTARPGGVASSPASPGQIPKPGARKRRTDILMDGFRPAVGLCVVNNDGLVFAARRMDDTEGTWQMPQGGIDCPEHHSEAAMRELKEETGIVSASIVHVARDWFRYEFPTEVRSMLTGRLLQYRGQKQMWHLIHFHGDDTEIDLEQHGQREFSDFTWLPLERLPDEVVAFKRGVYRQVAEEFVPIIEQRRQPDGTFKPWEVVPKPSGRDGRPGQADLKQGSFLRRSRIGGSARPGPVLVRIAM